MADKFTSPQRRLLNEAGGSPQGIDLSRGRDDWELVLQQLQQQKESLRLNLKKLLT